MLITVFSLSSLSLILHCIKKNILVMEVTQSKTLFWVLFTILCLLPSQLLADEGGSGDTTWVADDGNKYTMRNLKTKEAYDRYFSEEVEEDSTMYYLNQFVFAVVRNIRDLKPLRLQTVSYSSFDSVTLKNREISSISDISGNVPNLLIADQGSARNATIIVRGFGSVQGSAPAMGMNIDNVPCLNSNTYDADLMDIANIEVLRGPQGTQTGRNTILGVTNVYTVSPLDYTGTRVSADYSTANSVKIKASTYQKIKDSLGIAVAASYKHTNGFFDNDYKQEKCDRSDAINGRFRIVWNPREKFKVDNVITGGFLKEGGFAYAPIDKYDATLPIAYDGENKYKRFHLSEGLVLQSSFEKFVFSSITGYQFLHDETKMDPDYTTAALITQEEKQTEHAVSHEFAFRSKEKTESDKKVIWDWNAGMFIFVKSSKQENPYTYHQEGLEQHFLGDINTTLHSALDQNILLKQKELTIQNTFDIPTVGLALYHQSEFTVNQKWTFLAGLRLNLENTSIDYTNLGELDYSHISMSNYEHLKKYTYGSDKITDKRILPKFSVQFRPDETLSFYASLSRGQKGGGFNTYLFNEMIQNKMLNEIADNLNLEKKGALTIDYSKEVSYKAEQSWNVEIGGHMLFGVDTTQKRFSERDRKDYSDAKIDLSFALFYIACHDQQVMVFPNGKTIGNRVVNADKSRSIGGEASLNIRQKKFIWDISYGLTQARFTDFEYDGEDYSGKTVPFAPTNTVGFGMQYIQPFRARLLDQMVFSLDWKGYGKTYWNIENSYSQQFYGLFNLGIAWQCKDFELKGWTKNLANKQYTTYSFSSLGQQYAQLGTPRQFGISVSYKFTPKKKELD